MRTPRFDHPLTIRTNKKKIQFLKQELKKRDMSLSDVIREALDQCENMLRGKVKAG